MGIFLLTFSILYIFIDWFTSNRDKKRFSTKTSPISYSIKIERENFVDNNNEGSRVEIEPFNVDADISMIRI